MLSEASIGGASHLVIWSTVTMVMTTPAVLRMAKVRALWQNDLNKWFCLATVLVFSAQTALSIVSQAGVVSCLNLIGVSRHLRLRFKGWGLSLAQIPALDVSSSFTVGGEKFIRLHLAIES